MLPLLRRWLSRDETRGDWPSEAAIALAREQRVLCLVADLLRGEERAASDLALRLAPVGTELRNRALLQAAELAISRLGAEGVPSARLKGADLLLRLYRHVGLRPMDDVDILVPRSLVARAVAILETGGFARPPGLLPLDHYLKHHFHVPVVELRTGCYVEIHWELLDLFRRGRLDCSRVWAETRELTEESLERRLTPELQLLYHALHFDKHGPFHEALRGRIGAAGALLHPSSEARLLWLVDLALVARDPELDRDRLVALAESTAVERGAQTSLAMGAELLEDERLEALASALRPRRVAASRRLWRSSIAMLLGPQAAHGMLRRARRMDPTLLVRPLRLLEVPLLLFPPPSELRRERGFGLVELAWRYPLHVLSTARQLLAAALSGLRWRARAALFGGAR